MFVSLGDLEKKLAHAEQWEALPRRPGEPRTLESLERGRDTKPRQRSHRPLAARALHPRSTQCVGTPRRQSVRDGGSLLPDAVLARAIAKRRSTRSWHGQTHRALSLKNQTRPSTGTKGDTSRVCGSGDKSIPGISKVILTSLTSQGTDAVMTDSSRRR